MKRLALTLTIDRPGGRRLDRVRAVPHQTSSLRQGRDHPWPERANALLVSGWKTTPAGRQLASGDMILSGQVSPDGKLFAFTNTGYTHHALHIVDLATEKEIATFQMEQAWSGLAFSPKGDRIYVSNGAAYKASDIQLFDRWDNGGWKEARVGYTLYGAVKDQTAVAWLGTSPDGTLLYALNNSDQHLYIIDTHGGRAVARLRVGDHPISARLSKDGKTLYVANLGSANVAIVDVSEPGRPAIAGTLATDPHPNDVALTADGRLFVSCGNTNNVIVFDTEVAAAARGHQHGARSESPGRQHAQLARAVAGWQAALRRERRQQHGVGGRCRRIAARAGRSGSFRPAGIRRWSRRRRTASDIVGSGKGNGTGPESASSGRSIRTCPGRASSITATS